MEKHDYLCGALVERAYAEAEARHAKAKEADRAARAYVAEKFCR